MQTKHFGILYNDTELTLLLNLEEYTRISTTILALSLETI